MEITEKWVGQSAGGRVFKEARALVKLGKITQVVRKGNVFQGMMQSGRKPLRIVVKVHGIHEVENLCNCSVSRATGAMCEHAAAVLLASIAQSVSQEEKPEKPATPEPELEMHPLEIRLSPNFPHEGLRAIHLRRAAAGTEVQQADMVLALWLQKHTGQVDATMLSLPESQLEDFFRAAAGHARIRSGEKPVEILQTTLRPPLEMELNEESDGETLWLRLADLESGEMLALGNSMAQWDENCLLLGSSLQDVSSPLEGVVSFSDLLSGDWIEIDTAKFVKRLDGLEKYHTLPESLGGLDVREGSPRMELEISGSTRALQARLSARYTEDVNVALGLAADTSDFPCRASEITNQWLIRNQDHEQQAISRLMDQGFEILDASGFLFLRGEDEVLDFLTISLPQLRKVWDVSTEEKLGRVESRLERIVPQFNIEEIFD